MRTVIQRVSEASVIIDEKCFSSIQKGLLVLISIENDDNYDDITWLSNKISKLRIFDDENKIMNLSVNDVEGEILIVSQFTLHASTVKGNRPSYIKAAKPDIAIPLYNKFVDKMQDISVNKVKTGIFGSMMKIKLVNDGPVTIIIDSKCRI